MKEINGIECLNLDKNGSELTYSDNGATARYVDLFGCYRTITAPKGKVLRFQVSEGNLYYFCTDEAGE